MKSAEATASVLAYLLAEQRSGMFRSIRENGQFQAFGALQLLNRYDHSAQASLAAQRLHGTPAA